MIARIRKSMEEKDKGFTLIELLVVMIIIGILAAIAIPVFLNQRKKAQDTAATSDVSTIGKEIATYYVDATDALASKGGVALDTNKRYTVAGSDIGKASNITPVVTFNEASTDVAAASQAWCVAIAYSGGTKSSVAYSAKDGLVKGGSCSNGQAS
ncbi:prepilin-type N-terminal cleavage/methylation domain-containing protein [Cellulomonas sp. JH27-2]|uniref:prepilin-type N-terminal cleavage/methylation domain-containing protein n=1 Tax=Cellulomonas sp. JH27-2 TaxID=2774139 RepID=UPI001782CD01|nr:prepilin-type N-terminal cleavage/methylation domain-containing protein [Cellulomonas sp. JH27-2]MBD8058752.1 prepilin-type N-terminal cleavage/methylation domain-containing protein [Cellulomonas sp. JH27-2]